MTSFVLLVVPCIIKEFRQIVTCCDYLILFDNERRGNPESIIAKKKIIEHKSMLRGM